MSLRQGEVEQISKKLIRIAGRSRKYQICLILKPSISKLSGVVRPLAHLTSHAE